MLSEQLTSSTKITTPIAGVLASLGATQDDVIFTLTAAILIAQLVAWNYRFYKFCRSRGKS